MKPIKDSSEFRSASNVALVGAALTTLSLASGCLCPPCAAGPTTAAASTGTATAAAAPAAATSVAGGSREVIWDGDDVARGQGWASCDKEAEGCKSTFAPASGEGANSSTGLKLHGEGPGWQGGGWNWFGWWPENAGTDISGYDELSLDVKVTAPAKDKAPVADAINLSLGCSADKKNSADAPLGKYAANATDGQWHQVKIPLKDFFSGKGAECDARTAWEFRVGAWSAGPVNFDIVVDNIVVSKK